MPAWPAHAASQVRLTCIDDRLLSGPFATQHGSAFEVRLAGGALSLTDDRRDTALRELLVPKALGPLDTVWLEMHLACGAVGLAGYHFASLTDELDGLRGILREAEAVVRNAIPGVMIRTRVVTPTGEDHEGRP